MRRGSRSKLLTVHPRACGEHRADRAAERYIPGSSPRLRGTHRLVIFDDEFCRFIPAPAGNTASLRVWRSDTPVHPRACGEHAPRSMASSVECGFIPAPAGNTGRQKCKLPFSTVHPRACGEHRARHSRRRVEVGSSPRLRGTRRARSNFGSFYRFIPAPAGNTQKYYFMLHQNTVHPRACGEHSWRPRWRPIRGGSSPRLRGTPSPHHSRSP